MTFGAEAGRADDPMLGGFVAHECAGRYAVPRRERVEGPEAVIRIAARD
ncbi:hypothetical protein [Halobaculum magnesiiphilum]|uniref:Uncharacterized protein n=1 Tax=Halobaculum magnesiiphilum TaxID=1017351 RepID=A0A8T8WIT1_9EURY|nr:hypothetical protein [Halobaculum magnesiiphilum]QZP39740.1 hypothetical protein K6T50_17350 [Halobaculum magnesiiphilum]